ncbi:MAG: radical SAM protein [Aquificae bacterium]|nr:radical SAM protein [Aquificota bacterium]
MDHIFGPVNSRRFGLSLGIDLFPERKVCNFDCLYCEIGKGKPVNTIPKPASPEKIIKELKEFLKKGVKPEVITITASGEPTLYPYLKELTEEIRKIKGKSKLLILSNGSTIDRPAVREALKLFDAVKISLDGADGKTFRKVNRPAEGISLESIIKGLESFRKEYGGQLILEVLFVRDVNDSMENIKRLAKVVERIKPDRIDIGTVDRPPAYRVNPLTDSELFTIGAFFKGTEVNVITGGREGSEGKVSLAESQIINTFRRRPFTLQDAKAVFDGETVERINSLLEKGVLKEKRINDRLFITV